MIPQLRELEAKRKCKVVHTKVGSDIVAMCFGLDEALNPQGSASGLVPFNFVRLGGPDMGRSRTLVGAKSGKHKKKGLVLNYCPFCGTKIYKSPPTRRALEKQDG